MCKLIELFDHLFSSVSSESDVYERESGLLTATLRLPWMSDPKVIRTELSRAFNALLQEYGVGTFSVVATVNAIISSPQRPQYRIWWGQAFLSSRSVELSEVVDVTYARDALRLRINFTKDDVESLFKATFPNSNSELKFSRRCHD